MDSRNSYYSAPFRQGGAGWLIGVGLLRVLRSARAGRGGSRLLLLMLKHQLDFQNDINNF